jgi:hypothetical protein
VGYRGSSRDAKYETLPNTAVTITLLDANYQKVTPSSFRPTPSLCRR